MSSKIAKAFVFFFGTAELTPRMSTPAFGEQNFKRWWMGGAEVDAAARELSDDVRAAARNPEEFHVSSRGCLARVLYCDQISRNAFRGTPEAFAYDEQALESTHAALELFDPFRELPGFGVYFLLMPLMHSEKLGHHDSLQKHVETFRTTFKELDRVANDFKKIADEHREVIVRFGRYPHRNKQFNRSSTAEEKEWLESPDLPIWAKSQ